MASIWGAVRSTAFKSRERRRMWLIHILLLGELKMHTVQKQGFFTQPWIELNIVHFCQTHPPFKININSPTELTIILLLHFNLTTCTQGIVALSIDDIYDLNSMVQHIVNIDVPDSHHCLQQPSWKYLHLLGSKKGPYTKSNQLSTEWTTATHLRWA